MLMSPVMPVYFLPWDIVMYQIQPWKTDGDVLTYAHACPSAEPRSKSNHTSGETGKSGLPYLASYEQPGSWPDHLMTSAFSRTYPQVDDVRDWGICNLTLEFATSMLRR